MSDKKFACTAPGCSEGPFSTATMLAAHKISKHKNQRRSGGGGSRGGRSYGQRKTLKQAITAKERERLKEQGSRMLREIQPIWHMPMSLYYRAPQTKDLTYGEPVISYLSDVEQAVKDILHSEEFEQMVNDRVKAKHGGRSVQIVRLTGAYNIQHCKMSTMERSMAKAKAEKSPRLNPEKYPPK